MTVPFRHREVDLMACARVCRLQLSHWASCWWLSHNFFFHFSSSRRGFHSGQISFGRRLLALPSICTTPRSYQWRRRSGRSSNLNFVKLRIHNYYSRMTDWFICHSSRLTWFVEASMNYWPVTSFVPSQDGRRWQLPVPIPPNVSRLPTLVGIILASAT